jgi:hypothetical protein
MSFLDFSEDVNRAVQEATDQGSVLSAKTTVHRMKLPNAVRQAGFRYLPFPGDYDVVVGVAPWSDPDLAALEELASYARSSAVRVTVFDIDELSFPEMLRLFPGMRRSLRTPVVIQYKEGEPTYYGEGYDAVLWLRQFAGCPIVHKDPNSGPSNIDAIGRC